MSDGWTLEIPAYGITLCCERLRRERHELVGELSVKCLLPGARTVGDHLLSTADFNFSSLRARQDRAKHLAERARTDGNVDWYGHLEEFCQGVFERERRGSPAVDIWDIPEPVDGMADDFSIDGLAFPRRLPSIIFGDGGSMKSYLALYICGRLALQGVKVAYFDWELEPDQHKKRFKHLFGRQCPRPTLKYRRCEYPLTSEIDSICRTIRDFGIQYAICDSISFAVDGRAEDHDTVLRYSRCCRQMAVGSLHVAHVNRSEEGDKKPFGSTFWHNAARCTWFAKSETSGPGVVSLGMHHRKANCGPLWPAVAFKVSFGSDTTQFTRVSIADAPDVAGNMPIWQRMRAILERSGSMTCFDLAEEMEAKVDTVRKEAKRKDRMFHVISGGSGEQDRIALVR